MTLAALAGAGVVAGMLAWGHEHHGPHLLETSWEILRVGSPGLVVGGIAAATLTWMAPALHSSRVMLQPDGRGSGLPGLMAIGFSGVLLGPLPTLLWAGGAWAIRLPVGSTTDRAMPAADRSLGGVVAGVLGCAFVPVLLSDAGWSWLGLLAIPLVPLSGLGVIVWIPMVAVGGAVGLPASVGLGLLLVSGIRVRDLERWGRIAVVLAVVMIGGSLLDAQLPVAAVVGSAGSLGPLQTASLGLLGVAMLGALVRRGPRGLLEAVGEG